jgi:hypothetical protein
METLDRGHETIYYNVYFGCPAWLRGLRPDAIVLHTTFLALRWHGSFALWERSTPWIGGTGVPVVALPQDEYDRSEVLEDWLLSLGVTAVFSIFGPAERDVLYPRLADRVRFERCLTGYVDDGLVRSTAGSPPLAARPLDLVYRARRLPYRYGRYGQLKAAIGDAAIAAARTRDLAIDVSCRGEDTIYGPAWYDFLGSGRAVLGCESGVSALDRRGEIRRRIEVITAADPTATFEAVSAQLPAGWDDHRFLALGPRHLEAAATRTAQILVEGEYEGVLEPWRHYLPVRADLADIGQALDRIRDTATLQEMVDRTHADVIASGRYSYRRLAEQIEGVLYDEGAGRTRRRPAPGSRQLARLAETPFAAPLPARPFALLAATGPRMAATWALTCLGIAARCRSARRLLLRYRSDRLLRADVDVERLLGDVLRLGMLERAAAGAATFGWTCTLSATDATRLVLTSGDPSTRSATCAGSLAAVRTVEWDHSSRGTEAPFRLAAGPEVHVWVGPGGRHEFPTLGSIAARDPAGLAAILSPLLAGGRRRP